MWQNIVGKVHFDLVFYATKTALGHGLHYGCQTQLSLVFTREKKRHHNYNHVEIEISIFEQSGHDPWVKNCVPSEMQNSKRLILQTISIEVQQLELTESPCFLDTQFASTYLLAEIKGRQNNKSTPISAYRKPAARVHWTVIIINCFSALVSYDLWTTGWLSLKGNQAFQ